MLYQAPTAQEVGRTSEIVTSGGGQGKPSNTCADSHLHNTAHGGTNGAYEVDE